MQGVFRDTLYSWRRILRSPLHNLLIVLSFALGIGANTSIFGLANGVLLKPLPYPIPDRLVAIVESSPGGGEEELVSPAHFASLREQARAFAHLAVWSEARSNLLTPGLEPERVSGAAVSADFFPALGSGFVLGRGFTATEGRPEDLHAVVISTSLWQRRFGKNPKIVGTRLILDEESYTVVGIIDSKDAYPEGAEIWYPLVLETTGGQGTSHWLSMIGRLAPDTPLERAQAEASAIARRIEQDPASANALDFKIYRLRDLLVRNIRPALFLLIAAVALVLLISCNNVATILLARLVSQERELAVRCALGCSTGQLVRLSLIEAVILSLLGGTLGLAFSKVAISVLLRLAGDILPRQSEITIDRSVMLFALGISLLTALLVGSLPLLRRQVALRPAAILSAASRSSGNYSAFVLRVGKLAATIAVALAVPALLVAGLLTHSLLKLMAVSPGFQADSTLTVDVTLPERSYSTAGQQSNFYDALLSSVQELPAVRNAGVIFPLPLSASQYHVRVAAQDRIAEGKAAAPGVDVSFISADLPAAMGVPLLQGRGFSDHDTATGPIVALVSQSLGRTLWPGMSPLGQRLVFNAFTKREPIVATVVGVVGDIHQNSLRDGQHLQAYRLIRQAARPEATLVVRTAAGSSISAGALREKLRRIDPKLSLDNFGTLASVVARSTRRERFQSLLASALGGLALFLTAAGLFGVISYGTAQRTHEIGVRLALGSTRLGVQRLLIGRAMLLVLAGCAMGLVLYFAISSALGALLFELSHTDPSTIIFVLSLVFLIASLAIVIPAQRATAIDPIIALRH